MPLTSPSPNGANEQPDRPVIVVADAIHPIARARFAATADVVDIDGTDTAALLQAVAMARGTTEDANPSRVIVFRTIGGEKVAGAFDLKAIRRAQAADPAIYGNDIVIVDGSRARQMYRDLMSTIPLLGILRPF